LRDEDRWALAAKVVVEHDMDLSVRMGYATSPLGEALRQAGDRALDWPELIRWTGEDAPHLLAALGAPEDTFENATMAIGAKVFVELSNGATAVETCEASVGSAGPATRRQHGAIVRQKFLSVGRPEHVLADLERVECLTPNQVVRTLARAVHVRQVDLPYPLPLRELLVRAFGHSE
jgi:hypothetical protein